MKRPVLAFALSLLLVAPAARAQQAPAVSVTGAVTAPLTLTARELATMPRASVQTESNGIATTYEGVWLAEVLRRAGVPMGSGLRGAALATYVVASASDGYRVVFSIGEIDQELTEGKLLLADMANGKPMVGETGAFRLVVPSDKRGARSVRMLSALTVVQAPK